MKMSPRSIKGRLFLWSFGFTSALLIVIGITMFYKIKNVIFSSVDNTLHSKMQIIAGLIHEEKDGKIEIELSEVTSGAGEGAFSVPRSGHYYKILIDGKILAVSKSLTDDNFDLSSGTSEYFNPELRERFYFSTGPGKEPIRVIRHDMEFHGYTITLFIAEDISNSFVMLKNFRKFLLTAVPVSILIVGLIGPWIARRSLMPLKEFSAKIDLITHKNLNERVDAGTKVSELDELAASFNDMLARLRSAFDAERRLISDVSHELKTPVSVIKSHCDVTLLRKRSEDEYAETLRTISTVSSNMANIIKDMLSLARLDSGLLTPANFKLFPLAGCIQDALDLCAVLAAKKNVTVSSSVEDGINILGDRERLTEAFSNIIENAVRYNKENGSVDISSARTNNHIKVSITDTGIGMRKEDLERIFGRFYRVDASRSSEGTGLGLSISKAVIESLNGSISVTSEFGKGSCFSITLPIAA